MVKYYPVTRRKIIEVPIGDGDVDVLFDAFVAAGDTLSGTLGPVQTQDSADISDVFVAQDARFDDSADVSVDLSALEGLVVEDSAATSDALSGTLGPIQIPDSLDAADLFVAQDVRFFDSARS